MNQRKGSNDLAEVDNYFYCLDIFKKLNKSFSVSAGDKEIIMTPIIFRREKKYGLQVFVSNDLCQG
jgi:hypothetical protein